MQNNSSSRGLSRFFRQRVHGRQLVKIPEMVRPDSELGRSKGVFENILRWEDDGGKIIEINLSTLDQPEKGKNNE